MSSANQQNEGAFDPEPDPQFQFLCEHVAWCLVPNNMDQRSGPWGQISITICMQSSFKIDINLKIVRNHFYFVK